MGTASPRSSRDTLDSGKRPAPTSCARSSAMVCTSATRRRRPLRVRLASKGPPAATLARWTHATARIPTKPPILKVSATRKPESTAGASPNIAASNHPIRRSSSIPESSLTTLSRVPSSRGLSITVVVTPDAEACLHSRAEPSEAVSELHHADDGPYRLRNDATRSGQAPFLWGVSIQRSATASFEPFKWCLPSVSSEAAARTVAWSKPASRPASSISVRVRPVLED
jgi:hypothetical protein